MCVLRGTGACVQMVVYVGIYPESGLRPQFFVLIQEHAACVRRPVRASFRGWCVVRCLPYVLVDQNRDKIVFHALDDALGGKR